MWGRQLIYLLTNSNHSLITFVNALIEFPLGMVLIINRLIFKYSSRDLLIPRINWQKIILEDWMILQIVFLCDSSKIRFGIYFSLMQFRELGSLVGRGDRKNAAAALGRSAKTLSEWARLKIGPTPVRVGGRIFYRWVEIQKFASA